MNIQDIIPQRVKQWYITLQNNSPYSPQYQKRRCVGYGIFLALYELLKNDDSKIMEIDPDYDGAYLISIKESPNGNVDPQPSLLEIKVATTGDIAMVTLNDYENSTRVPMLIRDKETFLQTKESICNHVMKEYRFS